jgi:hypothetical protein
MTAGGVSHVHVILTFSELLIFSALKIVASETFPRLEEYP